MQGFSAIGLNPASVGLLGPGHIQRVTADPVLAAYPCQLKIKPLLGCRASRDAWGLCCVYTRLGAEHPVPQLINRVCFQQVLPAAVGLG